MLPIPEWAPSVHPLIIHFPLVLFFIAVFSDLLALAFKRAWLRWAASGLYVLGALSALAAFYTGREAAEQVFLTASANSVLTDHANWAEWTVWFYGLYVLARVAGEWKQFAHMKVVQVVFVVVGAVGLLLVKETGEHGAQLVYQHGVGVSRLALTTHTEEPKEAHTDHDNPNDGHHDEAQTTNEKHVHDDGHAHTSGDDVKEITESSTGWKWDVERGDIFQKQFQRIMGNEDDVLVGRDHSENGGLTLQTNDAPVLFVAGSSVKNVQYDLRINLDAFTGTVQLAHHVLDAKNYNFMSVDDAQVTLGRVENGKMRIEDQSSVSNKGWLDVRVVSDGTHFRGYINKKMVVHGHGTEPKPGRVGLFLNGTGILMVDDFDVQVLR